jgi:hypothetical protein
MGSSAISLEKLFPYGRIRLLRKNGWRLWLLKVLFRHTSVAWNLRMDKRSTVGRLDNHVIGNNLLVGPLKGDHKCFIELVLVDSERWQEFDRRSK